MTGLRGQEPGRGTGSRGAIFPNTESWSEKRGQCKVLGLLHTCPSITSTWHGTGYALTGGWLPPAPLPFHLYWGAG